MFKPSFHPLNYWLFFPIANFGFPVLKNGHDPFRLFRVFRFLSLKISAWVLNGRNPKGIIFPFKIDSNLEFDSILKTWTLLRKLQGSAENIMIFNIFTRFWENRCKTQVLDLRIWLWAWFFKTKDFIRQLSEYIKNLSSNSSINFRSIPVFPFSGTRGEWCYIDLVPY